MEAACLTSLGEMSLFWKSTTKRSPNKFRVMRKRGLPKFKWVSWNFAREVRNNRETGQEYGDLGVTVNHSAQSILTLEKVQATAYSGWETVAGSRMENACSREAVALPF